MSCSELVPQTGGDLTDSVNIIKVYNDNIWANWLGEYQPGQLLQWSDLQAQCLHLQLACPYDKIVVLQLQLYI
jgi:hypothetical protein